MRIGSHWAILDRLSSGRFLTRVRTADPVLYLSFDDGPHPQHTPALLDLLARYDAQASFFMVGAAVARHTTVAVQVARAGHTIGNHSYSHTRMTTIRPAERCVEYERTEQVLRGVDGRESHPYRPPYGSVPYESALRCLLSSARLVLWSVDSLDHRGDSAAVVRDLGAARMRPGDILLFHDDAATALEALTVLLPQWRDQGFSFRALP